MLVRVYRSQQRVSCYAYSTGERQRHNCAVDQDDLDSRRTPLGSLPQQTRLPASSQVKA
jgi:hypothetical protein